MPPQYDNLKPLHLDIALVKQGKPAATIVIPGPGVYEAAAATVQGQIEKRTGVKVPIVSDDSAEAAVPIRENLIVLGNRSTNKTMSALYDLFYWANRIRIRFVGRDVKFCAIVAAKVGGCSEDCKFCSQSAHYDTPVEAQSKLTDEQILASSVHAAEVGADSFGIVNSGRSAVKHLTAGAGVPIKAS